MIKEWTVFQVPPVPIFRVLAGLGFFMKKGEKPGSMKGLAMLSSMGIALAVSTILGLAFGWWLDRLFGTSPLLMIIFMILGVIGGFRSIYITIKRYDN